MVVGSELDVSGILLLGLEGLLFGESETMSSQFTSSWNGVEWIRRASTHEKHSPKLGLGHVDDEPVHLASLWPEAAEFLGRVSLHRLVPGGEVPLCPVPDALHAAVFWLVVSYHGAQLDEEVICCVLGRSHGSMMTSRAWESIQYAVSSDLS